MSEEPAMYVSNVIKKTYEPHNIPIGTLVEIQPWDDFSKNRYQGVRLYVIDHQRDCDGSPLYVLYYDKTAVDDTTYNYIMPLLGFSDESLKIIS